MFSAWDILISAVKLQSLQSDGTVCVCADEQVYSSASLNYQTEFKMNYHLFVSTL